MECPCLETQFYWQRSKRGRETFLDFWRYLISRKQNNRVDEPKLVLTQEGFACSLFSLSSQDFHARSGIQKFCWNSVNTKLQPCPFRCLQDPPNSNPWCKAIQTLWCSSALRLGHWYVYSHQVAPRAFTLGSKVAFVFSFGKANQFILPVFFYTLSKKRFLFQPLGWHVVLISCSELASGTVINSSLVCGLKKEGNPSPSYK